MNISFTRRGLLQFFGISGAFAALPAGARPVVTNSAPITAAAEVATVVPEVVPALAGELKSLADIIVTSSKEVTRAHHTLHRGSDNWKIGELREFMLTLPESCRPALCDAINQLLKPPPLGRGEISRLWQNFHLSPKHFHKDDQSLVFIEDFGFALTDKYSGRDDPAAEFLADLKRAMGNTTLFDDFKFGTRASKPELVERLEVVFREFSQLHDALTMLHDKISPDILKKLADLPAAKKLQELISPDGGGYDKSDEAVQQIVEKAVATLIADIKAKVPEAIKLFGEEALAQLYKAFEETRLDTRITIEGKTRGLFNRPLSIWDKDARDIPAEKLYLDVRHLSGAWKQEGYLLQEFEELAREFYQRPEYEKMNPRSCPAIRDWSIKIDSSGGDNRYRANPDRFVPQLKPEPVEVVKQVVVEALSDKPESQQTQPDHSLARTLGKAVTRREMFTSWRQLVAPAEDEKRTSVTETHAPKPAASSPLALEEGARIPVQPIGQPDEERVPLDRPSLKARPIQLIVRPTEPRELGAKDGSVTEL